MHGTTRIISCKAQAGAIYRYHHRSCCSAAAVSLFRSFFGASVHPPFAITKLVNGILVTLLSQRNLTAHMQTELNA